MTTIQTIYAKVRADARREAEALDEVMRSIQRARKIWPECRRLAGTPAALGLSASRLRSKFYHWSAAAEPRILALINHNRCGGCGLPGCGKAQETALPEALLEEWRHRAGSNDKRAFSQAWRTLLADLAHGKSLPGVGTWMELHLDLYPMREIPEKCPWSLHRPPPGWSQGNFQRQRQPEAELALQKKGYFEAAKLLPMVRMDLSQLRPLQRVVFDDHPLDFRVMVEDGRGRFQAVRMLGLFAMDVSTRQIIAFGLRPQLEREDGTKEGLTLRDMQHVIAQVLSRFGFPKNHTMELIVENGTAAISEELEKLLGRVSGGSIIVRRTGMIDGDLGMEGFGERSGNPRGKPWLESYFSLLDTVLGEVRGQTGSNYTRKPGDHEGRLTVAKRMARIIEALPEEKRHALAAPFESARDALFIVDAAIKLLNARTEHELVGFERVTQFRFDESSAWLPLNPARASSSTERETIERFLALPEPMQDLIIGNKATCTARMESPLERWQRLWKNEDYHSIPTEVFLDLLLDARTALYNGGDVIDVKLGRDGRLLRFRGDRHTLQIGQQVQCRLDTENPQIGVWFQDEAGRYLGMMRADGDIADVERLQRDLGARAKAAAELQQRVRSRLGSGGRLERRIDDFNRTIEVLSALDEPALENSPCNEGSRELVNEVMRPQMKKPRRRNLEPDPEAQPPRYREAFSFEE